MQTTTTRPHRLGSSEDGPVARSAPTSIRHALPMRGNRPNCSRQRRVGFALTALTVTLVLITATLVVCPRLDHPEPILSVVLPSLHFQRHGARRGANSWTTPSYQTAHSGMVLTASPPGDPSALVHSLPLSATIAVGGMHPGGWSRFRVPAARKHCRYEPHCSCRRRHGRLDGGSCGRARPFPAQARVAAQLPPPGARSVPDRSCRPRAAAVRRRGQQRGAPVHPRPASVGVRLVEEGEQLFRVRHRQRRGVHGRLSGDQASHLRSGRAAVGADGRARGRLAVRQGDRRRAGPAGGIPAEIRDQHLRDELRVAVRQRRRGPQPGCRADRLPAEHR